MRVVQQRGPGLDAPGLGEDPENRSVARFMQHGAVRQREVVGLPAVAAEQALHRPGAVLRAKANLPVEPVALIGDRDRAAGVPAELVYVGRELGERASREALRTTDLQPGVRR